MLVFTGKSLNVSQVPVKKEKEKVASTTYLLKLSTVCDLTAGDTVYPGSRNKWKLQLKKVASGVDHRSATKIMTVHCHTADAVGTRLKVKTFTARNPHPTPP